jgi:hypothetical protein
MWAINHIDPQRCSAHGDQVAVSAFGIRAARIVKVIWLPVRLNLLAIDEGAVSAAEITDMNDRWLEFQLAMVAGDHFVSFRAGKLDEAIQRPADLTTRGPAETKLAVLVGPRNYGESDCFGHDTDSFDQGFIGYSCLAKRVPQKGGAKMLEFEGLWRLKTRKGMCESGT